LNSIIYGYLEKSATALAKLYYHQSKKAHSVNVKVILLVGISGIGSSLCPKWGCLEAARTSGFFPFGREPALIFRS